jgi:hypothetical protein
MTLHPLGSGFAHRSVLLDRFLGHVCALPDIWNATGSQCADWWQSAYPKDHTLGLEPSIWKDYPGSLS